MSSNFLFSSKPFSLPSTKPLNSHPLHFPSTSPPVTFSPKPPNLIPPLSATSTSTSIPFFPEPQIPFNVEYLQSEFGSHGVSFAELGSNYVAKLVHENGSSASILMPPGLITSYKPKMWHGSSVEVLQTSVSDGIQGAVIKGGVSLALNFEGDDDGGDGFSWSPSTWVLNDVKGTSQDSIQIEMMSRDSRKMVELKYNITLKQDTLSSEISISNSRSSKIQLTGSILSHLTVSTPDATYAFGLERSNFFSRPPLVSDFCIVPPNLAKDNENWPLSSFKKLFPPKKDEKDNQKEVEDEGEEEENYKHLTETMSKIYTCAPRSFTIIDRGKRNSVVVGRRGFEELYLYSPGSSHEHYGKYAFICVGQSAILKPIILPPRQQWRGEQQLHNPNI